MSGEEIRDETDTLSLFSVEKRRYQLELQCRDRHIFDRYRNLNIETKRTVNVVNRANSEREGRKLE